MGIDETIYVRRPDVVKLNDELIDFVELNSAIHEAASGATEISLLGGYYNVNAIVELCKQVPRTQRRDCRVRVAVGLEATALIPRTWEDMRGLRQNLRKAGFRDVKVAVVSKSPVHFHTKLFRILRTTHPVWFIGSANPGSDRHELMVRVSGRHEALSAYVNAVFEQALVVDGAPSPSVEIKTLRDFFLTGVLCHKPPEQRLFTFDAFRLTSENRDTLSAVLAGEAGIEHARPRTEGFGFSLKSALGMDDHALDEDEDTAAQRIQYRRSCVDTVLGLWMPHAYAKEVQGQIEVEKVARLRILEKFADVLSADSGQLQAHDAFRKHVASMERLLAEHGIEARPAKEREKSFERFLRSRTAALANDDTRDRLASTMTLTNMPDIWQDDRAVKAFESSAFDDLSYRLGMITVTRSRIVKSFAAALGLDGGETAEEIRECLERRLSDKPWSAEEWE